VWFLAGNLGGESTRTCTVPSGKAIFFPLVNYLNDYPCPDPSFHPAPGQSLQDFLAQGAAGLIDAVDILEAQVDGAPLQDLFGYRGISSLLTFTGDPSWVSLDSCITGSEQFGVSDGYWVMLAPLKPGTHTIHLRGGISAFGFEVNVTYNLAVSQ
jgi:hypothetical protein